MSHLGHVSRVLQVLVTCVVVGYSSGSRGVQPPPCPGEWPHGVKLEHVLQSDTLKGSITAHLIYPPRTYWKFNNSYYGCPCMIRTCVRVPVCISKNESETMPKILEISQQYFVDFQESMRNEPYFDSKYFYMPESIVDDNMCGVNEMAIEHDPEDYTIKHSENGSLVVSVPDAENKNNHYYFMDDKFCLNRNNGIESSVLCCDDSDLMEHPPLELRHQIYPWIQLLSVVFLGITLVAYHLAPEMRNLHGQCMATHASCFLVGNIGLAFSSFFSQKINLTTCYVIGVITYFFLLATFFWLNVMCFSIWWSFSGFKKMRSSTENNRRKYILFSIYAWSIPLLFLILVLGIDNDPTSAISEDHKPKFGISSCWLQNKNAELYYFYGPLCYVIGTNIALFAATAHKMMKLKKETSVLKREGSRINMGRKRKNQEQINLALCVKLFVLMGLCWSLEVISWAVGEVEGLQFLWYPTDILNMLQGVFIFVLCVWTTKTRNALVSRLCPSRVRGKLTYKLSTTSTTAGAKDGSFSLSEVAALQQIELAPGKEI